MTDEKIAPQALDFEEIVLGAMMLEAECIDTVISIPLLPEHFFKPEHQIIFKAISKLYQEKKPTHIVMVCQQLKTTSELESVGGAYYITRLTNRVAGSGNIEYHCRIIIEQYLRREGFLIAQKSSQQFLTDNLDIFDTMEKVQQSYFDLIAKTLRKSYSRLSDSIGSAISIITNNNGKEMTGITTGFVDLDAELYGWQKSDLIIIAARPSLGKTSLVLCSAIATAKLNIPVAIFSLEMSETQLINKVLACESEIPLADIRQQKLSLGQIEQMKKIEKSLTEIPLFIDETPSLSIFEFRAKARRMKQQNGIQLLIVDYLQLMTAKGFQSREAEVSYISRSLKAVAKELDIPVIALSQMSRKVEERSKSNNRPQLSDLRESGSIEQDADVVLLLYRPEYYKQLKDTNGNDLKGVAEIIIAKHRNGAIGSVYLKFVAWLTKFTDMDKDSFATNPDFQHTSITEEEF